MDDKFDELLMTVAAQSGGVEGLLKTFFGFLNRRTDFYALIPDHVTEPKMGFRPGAAEALVSVSSRSPPSAYTTTTHAAGEVLQKLSIQRLRRQHRGRSSKVAAEEGARATCAEEGWGVVK